MNNKPNLNKIISSNLDKAKFQSKSNPSLPTDGWLDGYSKGGYISDSAKATQFGQYKEGGDPNQPYHPITNPDGYRPSLEKILKLPNKEKRYEPSQAVNNAKAILAGVDLSTGFSSNPFVAGANILARIANSTGDAYTAARYAMDGQWKNAGVDAGEALLDLIPFRKGKQVINLSKTNNLPGTYNKLSKLDKSINRGLKVGKAAASTDDFMHSTLGKFLFGDPDSNLQYKRGGGYFPEYHSFAPPRMDNGGNVCYDDKGNEIPCVEKTYTYEPGKRGAYRLQRTITPYTSNRDIKRFTEAPTDPRQVNFLQNYAGAISGYQDDPGFNYPTQVPIEGDKHWNIDRFIIDPQFGGRTASLYTTESTAEQNRANTLTDMYKYYMLQDPEHKGRAFRKAKRFVRNEVDSRTKGPFLQSYNTSTEDPTFKGWQGTSEFASQNRLKDLYWNEAIGEGTITPEQIDKLKNVSLDYFKNYKKMSKKEAENQWKNWEEEANKFKETGTLKNGGDISIPNLDTDKWLTKYDEGGEPCPPDHVRINSVCVSIYSDEYKKLYKDDNLFVTGDFNRHTKSGSTGDPNDVNYLTNDSIFMKEHDLPMATVYANSKKGNYENAIKRGKQFNQDWINSPMYKKMLNASTKQSSFTPINLNNYDSAANIQKRRQDQLDSSSWNVIDPNTVQDDRGAETRTFSKWNAPMLGSGINKWDNVDYSPVVNFVKGTTGVLGGANLLSNSTHEFSHITDASGTIIPKADIRLMNKYKTVADDWNKNWTNYVGKPTETRARLNDFRQRAKRQGLYDPFTQPFKKDLLYKYNKDTDWDGWDPLQQLRDVYNDDQITDMLNKISKSDTSSKIQDKVKYGGWLTKYKPGGVTGPGDGVQQVYIQLPDGRIIKSDNTESSQYAKYRSKFPSSNEGYYNQQGVAVWRAPDYLDQDAPAKPMESVVVKENPIYTEARKKAKGQIGDWTAWGKKEENTYVPSWVNKSGLANPMQDLEDQRNKYKEELTRTTYQNVLDTYPRKENESRMDYINRLNEMLPNFVDKAKQAGLTEPFDPENSAKMKQWGKKTLSHLTGLASGSPALLQQAVNFGNQPVSSLTPEEAKEVGVTQPFESLDNIAWNYGFKPGINAIDNALDPSNKQGRNLASRYTGPTASDMVFTGLMNPLNYIVPGEAMNIGRNTIKGVGELASGTKNLYNTIATGESILPIAWKSPAVGLTQEASQEMFNALRNSDKLTDAERALIVEYQHNSKPFTGRAGFVDEGKKVALNNIIKKYNLNVGDNVVLTRRFNPTNQSLGANLESGKLNFGDRPTSFSAGVGLEGYNSGAVDRIVVPGKYSKQMGSNLLANQYDKLSEEALSLLPDEAHGFASWLGNSNAPINAEREVLGTGLDFKRIGKVKNDIGGYDWIVKPNASGGLPQPKQSGFSFGNLKEMFTNPKQYFTKPGGPATFEPIYENIQRAASEGRDPFSETLRFGQWTEAPRVLDWSKIGKTAVGAGVGSGLLSMGLRNNKKEQLPVEKQPNTLEEIPQQKNGGWLTKYNVGGEPTGPCGEGKVYVDGVGCVDSMTSKAKVPLIPGIETSPKTNYRLAEYRRSPDKNTQAFYDMLRRKSIPYDASGAVSGRYVDGTVPPEDQDYYGAIMDMGMKYGYPNVTSSPDIKRAHFAAYGKDADRMFVGQKDIKSTVDDYISELAHHNQYAKDPVAFKKRRNKEMPRIIGNQFLHLFGGKGYDDIEYNRPGRIEHEAHREIEPGLQNEYKEILQNITYPNKKNGGELTRYNNGGRVIKDDRGQWAHPGKVTEIQGNNMATHGYGNIPLYVEANNGFKGMIPANSGNHVFPGASKFVETPMFQKGGKTGVQTGTQNIGSPAMPIIPNLISMATDVINWFTGDKSKEQPVKSGASDLEETIHIKLDDPRKTRMTTGQKINPNKDLKAGDYILNEIQEALKLAKKRGLSKDDLYNLAAMDLAETGWGNTDDNTGHVLDGKGKNPAEKFVNAYIDKMKYADRLHIKDPLKRLQVYNGMGSVYPTTEKDYHGFVSKAFYGVPVPKTGINLATNPLYGKEITDLRENVLKKNPRFVSFMNNLYDNKKLGGEINWLDRYK